MRYIVVYITNSGNTNTDYVDANSPQKAADTVREWEEDGIEILEVAKVLKGWK